MPKELSGNFSPEEKARVTKDGKMLLIRDLTDQLREEKNPDKALRIQAKINELMSPDDEPSPPSEDEHGSDSSSPENNAIDEIGDMQSSLIDNLKDGIASGAMEMLGENGKPIDPQKDLKMGQQVSGGTVELKGGATNEVRAGLSEIYNKFSELGFETMQSQKTNDEGRTSYFFGINFPPNYRGNKSPITMTPEQISEACHCLKTAKAQGLYGANISSEAIGPTKDEMEKFHGEQRAEFLKDILNRGPRGKQAGQSFADMVSQSRTDEPQGNSRGDDLRARIERFNAKKK